MKRTIRKVGNSTMISITPAVLELLDLKVGDIVDATVKGGKLEIVKIKKETK